MPDDLIRKLDGDIAVMPVKRFKFRAECLFDISMLLQALLVVETIEIAELHIERWKNDGGFYPDCDCVIALRADVDELKLIMRMLPNSHVMVETVKPIDEYTGERSYGG